MKNIRITVIALDEFTFSLVLIKDRKIAIVKFRDRKHLAIIYSTEDRRSPRNHEKKIADQISDRAIGDRSCLDLT